MLHVQFTVEHPILRATLRQTPEARVTWERSDVHDDGTIRMLVWVECESYDEFDAALDADQSIERPRQEIALGDRRLYQMDVRDDDSETSVYRLLSDEGTLIHEVYATTDGWTFRVTLADRSVLESLREYCRVNDLPLELHRMYARQGPEAANVFGLTEPQFELLNAAIETGYLEIPRESSLEELAAELDISHSAASERFRRAVKNLVESTIRDPSK